MAQKKYPLNLHWDKINQQIKEEIVSPAGIWIYSIVFTGQRRGKSCRFNINRQAKIQEARCQLEELLDIRVFNTQVKAPQEEETKSRRREETEEEEGKEEEGKTATEDDNKLSEAEGGDSEEESEINTTEDEETQGNVMLGDSKMQRLKTLRKRRKKQVN